MYSKENLKIQLFEEKDIEVLTPIMKRTFDEDSRLHLGEAEGEPPNNWGSSQFILFTIRV